MIMNNLSKSPRDSSIIYPDNQDLSESLDSLENNVIYQSQQPNDEIIPQKRKTPKFPSIELKALRKSTKKVQKKVNNLQNIFSKKLNSLLSSKNNINLKSTKSFRKTKEMEFIHSKYLYNCLLQGLFSIISILSAIIEYEHTVIIPEGHSTQLVHTNKDDLSVIQLYDINPNFFNNCQNCSKISSYVSLTASIFLWVTIFFDFVLSHQIAFYQTTKDYHSFFKNRETIIWLIITFIIFIPCPNPFTFGINVYFTNNTFNSSYEVPLNSIFTAICLFRFWFVFKYFLVSSKTYTQRASRLCKMNNVDFNLSFPFKSHMTLNPLNIDTLLFLFSLFICAYNIRIFERYLDPYSLQDFSNFYNALWCVFITMTTVGYGDLTPNTEFGRLFAMVGCLSGVFLLSLIVVSVSNYFNIQGIELNVLNVIDRAYIMDRKNENGEIIVKNILVAKKKMGEIKNNITNNNLRTENVKNLDVEGNNKELKQYREKIFKQLKKFQSERVKLEKAYPSFNSFDEIMAYLKFLEEDIAKNDRKVDNIIDLLDQINSYFVDNGDSRIN